MRRIALLAVAALLCACPLAAAHAAGQSARLRVGFTPERLGHTTSLSFDVRISAPAGGIPPPLTAMSISYPSSIGLAVSGLGLVGCPMQALEALGPDACPADSRMGHGSALAEIAVGPATLRETAEIAILRSPNSQEHIALLLYATAGTPVFAELPIPATLAPTASPALESINIDVPLVPSLPGAPDVSIVALHASIGPRGLTYYEHAHGRTIPYHPQGILLPHKCPRGGFRFTANLTFLDKTRAKARTSVPCNGHRRAGRKRA